MHKSRIKEGLVLKSLKILFKFYVNIDRTMVGSVKRSLAFKHIVINKLCSLYGNTRNMVDSIFGGTGLLTKVVISLAGVVDGL